VFSPDNINPPLNSFLKPPFKKAANILKISKAETFHKGCRKNVSDQGKNFFGIKNRGGHSESAPYCLSQINRGCEAVVYFGYLTCNPSDPPLFFIVFAVKMVYDNSTVSYKNATHYPNFNGLLFFEVRHHAESIGNWVNAYQGRLRCRAKRYFNPVKGGRRT